MVNVKHKTDQLITVSYARMGQESRLHRVLIPWTDDYNNALDLAKTMLKRHFPEGTEDEFRWLSCKGEDGRSWTELHAGVFPAIARELEDKAEIRLSENDRLESVKILPLSHNEDTYYQFKVIIIGPSAVGKTMLLQYLTKPESARMDTLEATTNHHADISNRFMTNNGTLLRAEIWDTAGQERYHSISHSLYRDVSGVLLVYNLTKKETFEDCERWRGILQKNVHNFEKMPVILVGNQVDLEEQREVTAEEAQRYADRKKFNFMEVSAKEGTNVEQTFKTLMATIFNGISARNELAKYKKSKGCDNSLSQNIRLNSNGRNGWSYSNCVNSVYDFGYRMMGRK
ncbi:Ras-related protein RABA4b OS=Arabidopsis thaliana GN=RABA4B PE=2 SV=1 [Rhizoctonia solani AG-1 IB]|uniref:Ras-related protein RABA4b n=1 Tax=Thanatephorus cucumeris (strain AG1-IB / isolate 7/3/14) TaxID=1108050 RepID=A0A0B7FE57_THACB|nr:Ras-related protein RABA4b OS=Arabidopsis thaliana GN=RABA4B PE=2 SV=1 [Rhizoctonia solani AG-1 IB]